MYEDPMKLWKPNRDSLKRQQGLSKRLATDIEKLRVCIDYEILIECGRLKEHNSNNGIPSSDFASRDRKQLPTLLTNAETLGMRDLKFRPRRRRRLVIKLIQFIVAATASTR